jgi:hypothetical protein
LAPEQKNSAKFQSSLDKIQDFVADTSPTKKILIKTKLNSEEKNRPKAYAHYHIGERVKTQAIKSSINDPNRTKDCENSIGNDLTRHIMPSCEDRVETDRPSVNIEPDRPLVTRESDNYALAAQLRVKKKSQSKIKEISAMGPQPINRLVHRKPSIGVAFDSDSLIGEDSPLPLADVESDLERSITEPRSPHQSRISFKDDYKNYNSKGTYVSRKQKAIRQNLKEKRKNMASVGNIDDFDHKIAGGSDDNSGGGVIKNMKTVTFIKSVVHFDEMVKNFEVPTSQFSSKVHNRNGSNPDEGMTSLNLGSGPLDWPNSGSQDSQSKKSCREGGSDGEPRLIGQVDSISNLESLDKLSMTHVE